MPKNKINPLFVLCTFGIFFSYLAFSDIKPASLRLFFGQLVVLINTFIIFLDGAIVGRLECRII
jgi:hypothetical protein